MNLRLVWLLRGLAFLPLAVPVASQAAIAVAQPVLALKSLVLDVHGRRHVYQVEVAATPEQQEAGLMFRRTMPAGRGMIFPFVPPRSATFWMENTILPLDIVFILPDNTVGKVVANAKPYSRDFIESFVPVMAVLELNAGEAARIGLRPGDRVEFGGNH